MIRVDREWYRLETALRLADELAALSTCRRLAVGCAIVTSKLERVLAVGYNGPPSSLGNDSCRGEPGACGCVHAEANALVKLTMRERGLTLCATHSPCRHCAGMIVNSGAIRRVVYRSTFRDVSGVETLRAAGVECSSASDAIPRTIVLGERANDDELTRPETDDRARWRAALASGAFRIETSARKLLSVGVDLSRTRSANLLPPSRSREWDAEAAARIAREALTDQPWMDWIACGRRVWLALTGDSSADWGDSFDLSTGRAILVPHPSGLNRWWNDARAVERLRETILERDQPISSRSIDRPRGVR